MFTNILSGGGILLSLLGLGLALGVFMTPDNGKNRSTRLAMLLGFAFFSGLGLGPLLDMAIQLNPSIVPSALMLTTVIFACFSAAALFSLALAPSSFSDSSTSFSDPSFFSSFTSTSDWPFSADSSCLTLKSSSSRLAAETPTSSPTLSTSSSISSRSSERLWFSSCKRRTETRRKGVK